MIFFHYLPYDDDIISCSEHFRLKFQMSQPASTYLSQKTLIFEKRKDVAAYLPTYLPTFLPMRDRMFVCVRGVGCGGGGCQRCSGRVHA